jgi:hypothetical protein
MTRLVNNDRITIYRNFTVWDFPTRFETLVLEILLQAKYLSVKESNTELNSDIENEQN